MCWASGLPKLYLHLLDEAGQDVHPCRWRIGTSTLNAALREACDVCAISTENEEVRFALSLRSAASRLPRLGSGTGSIMPYSSITLRTVPSLATDGGIDSQTVYRNGIDPTFRSYAECRDLIDAAIRGRAMELVEDFQYDRPDAEEILAAAVAQYLDERFSVTNRRVMGLL